MEPYYTLVIPFVAKEFATEWHPTEDKGPFARLTRGNFKTPEDAIRWGREKLAGTPYEIKRIEMEPLIVTITAEKSASRTAWRVSDDGGMFDEAYHATRELAAVDVNARHDRYIAADDMCSVQIRSVL